MKPFIVFAIPVVFLTFLTHTVQMKPGPEKIKTLIEEDFLTHTVQMKQYS